MGRKEHRSFQSIGSYALCQGHLGVVELCGERFPFRVGFKGSQEEHRSHSGAPNPLRRISLRLFSGKRCIRGPQEPILSTRRAPCAEFADKNPTRTPHVPGASFSQTSGTASVSVAIAFSRAKLRCLSDWRERLARRLRPGPLGGWFVFFKSARLRNDMIIVLISPLNQPKGDTHTHTPKTTPTWVARPFCFSVGNRACLGLQGHKELKTQPIFRKKRETRKTDPRKES